MPCISPHSVRAHTRCCCRFVRLWCVHVAFQCLPALINNTYSLLLQQVCRHLLVSTIERETERDRERERERQRERDKERETERERQRDRQTETQTERQ